MKKINKIPEINLFSDYDYVEENNVIVGSLLKATEEIESKKSVKQSKRIEVLEKKSEGCGKIYMRRIAIW